MRPLYLQLHPQSEIKETRFIKIKLEVEKRKRTDHEIIRQIITLNPKKLTFFIVGEVTLV